MSDDPSLHGSLVSRSSSFLLVVAITPEVAEDLQLKANFFQIFNRLRLGAWYNFDKMAMTPELLEKFYLPIAKIAGATEEPIQKVRKKESLSWMMTHEELFSYTGLKWPPRDDVLPLSFMDLDGRTWSTGFTKREADNN